MLNMLMEGLIPMLVSGQLVSLPTVRIIKFIKFYVGFAMLFIISLFAVPPISSAKYISWHLNKEIVLSLLHCFKIYSMYNL